jgi:hypothetical protein
MTAIYPAAMIIRRRISMTPSLIGLAIQAALALLFMLGDGDIGPSGATSPHMHARAGSLSDPPFPGAFCG